MHRALPLLALLALAGSAVPVETQAAVRRCELPDGQTVYTDRRCDAIGAVERRAAAPQAQFRRYRATCARSVRDLYFEVSAALESRDANRLAGVYHWPGMSTRQGYDVMQRLQRIVDRGLVDLQPVYPGGEDAYASTTRPPVAFRIEQVAANGSTPVRASLGIRRHLDCWWVTLGGGGAVRAPKPAPAADAADAVVASPLAAPTPPAPPPPPAERP